MTTLAPATLDDQAWRRWLRDGARLAGRSLTGWGLLFLLFFVGRGYMIAQGPAIWPLLAFVAVSGAVELAHFAVFRELMSGHVALGTSLRAIGRFWKEAAGVIGRTVRTRLLIGGGFLLVAHGLMLLVRGAVPVAPAPVGGFWAFVVALANSTDASIGPLLVRLGGAVSVVLPLMVCHGVPAWRAAWLNRDALDRNRRSLMILIVGFSTALVLFANPLLAWLVPLVELWLSATIACVYADLFEGGYAIKALARAPAKVRSAHAVRVPVRGS